KVVEQQLKELSMRSTGDYGVVSLPTEPLSAASSPGSSRTPSALAIPLQTFASVSDELDKTASLLVTSARGRASRIRNTWRGVVALALIVGAGVLLARARRFANGAAPNAQEPMGPAQEHALQDTRIPEATLTIRASPSYARLYVDDGPPLENPFIGKLPR